MKMRPFILILGLYIIYIPLQIHFPAKIGGITVLNPTNIFIVILSFMCLQSSSKKKLANSTNSLVTVISLFILIEFISFVLTGLNIDDNLVHLKREVFTVLPLFIVLRCVRSKDEIKTLLFIILLTAFLVSFEIARDNSFKPGGYNKNFSNLVRVVGPFEGVGGANGANEAAAFLGQFCPLLLAYFLFIRLNKYYRIISLSTFLLCVYSLIFTYSRAGYISIVLSTLFVTLMKDKKNLLIILLLLLTAPKWAPPSMMQRIEMTTVEDEWTGETKLESSANTREIIWDGAVQMIKQHPMGVGFENFKREIVKYIPEGISQRDAHNNYIMIAAELGIIGLIVFIVMWVLLYKCAWSLYRDAERLDDDFYKAISIAFIGCLISMTVTNIFGTHFFDNRVAGVMWIMSGLIIKAKIITSEQN